MSTRSPTTIRRTLALATAAASALLLSLGATPTSRVQALLYLAIALGLLAGLAATAWLAWRTTRRAMTWSHHCLVGQRPASLVVRRLLSQPVEVVGWPTPNLQGGVEPVLKSMKAAASYI